MNQTNKVEQCLTRLADELTPDQRAEIRQFAVQYIKSGATGLKFCDVPAPHHLAAEVKRAIIEEAYVRRCKGQRFIVRSHQLYL